MFYPKLIEITTQLGLEANCIKFSKNVQALCWDGKGIINSNNDSNFAHEIAHYLVASPDRRLIPNYGLGRCPDEQFSHELTYALNSDEIYNEEKEASVLGILIERQLGLNWKKAMIEHQWDNFQSKKDFIRIKMKLIEIGLVSKQGVLQPFKQELVFNKLALTG